MSETAPELRRLVDMASEPCGQLKTSREGFGRLGGSIGKQEWWRGAVRED